MTEILLKLFIRNYKDTENEKVRLAYGTLSSITGICCNIFLFALKFTIGSMMNVVAITGDAFNNLSDCITCIVALFGYHMAAKPADREHPFGHGRMEYVVSFMASILICAVGVQLLRDSAEKILHPSEISFSIPMFCILTASVLVKVWMSFFYKKLGTATNNTIMLASSQDSRSDVFTTSATLISLLAALVLPSIPVDGIAGAAVSLLVLKAGYSLAKEIIDRLLGRPADAELFEKIKKIILSNPETIGVHDVIVHDYGPGRMIGTAHVELDSRMSFLDAHNTVDRAERELMDKLHISMTLHMDPVETDDAEAMMYRQKIIDLLKSIDSGISMHDFQHVHHGDHLVLYFDVLIPYGVKEAPVSIQKRVNEYLASEKNSVSAVIAFDHNFTEEL